MRRLSPGSALALLILLFAPTLGLAQESAQPEPATPRSRRSYRIRPGDKLSIALADHPEESKSEILVSTDGTISFYTVNNFRIAGLTREEAERQIEQRLDLIHPKVSINFVEAPGMMITVSGAVEKPGPLDYNEGITLLDAVARAGGLKDTADVTALVTSSDGSGLRKTRTLDLLAAETGRGENPVLDPGDLVHIGEATVGVNGEVKKPGTYPLRVADTVFRAVAMAEGVTMQGDPRQIVLKRDGKSYLVDLDSIAIGPVDLEAAQLRPDAEPRAALPGDVSLKARDMVYVPAAAITVSGEVGNPSQFALTTIDTGLRALSNAKGPTVYADLEHSFILRNGGQERIPIDLTAVGPEAPMVYDGVNPVGANFGLKRGDVLVVPRKKARVRVFGAVNRSGDYYFVPGTKDHLLDALAEAGLPPQADLRKVRLQRVFRGAPEVLVLDVSATTGVPANNVILRDGDQIQVPERKEKGINPLFYSLGSALMGAFIFRQ